MVRVIFLIVLLSASAGVRAAGVDELIRGKQKTLEWTRFFAPPLSEGQSHAVLIGISDYIGTSKGGFKSLESKNDVKKMRDFLIDRAGFDSVQILTEEKATKARIESLMVDELPSRVRKADRVLFYWSGHGIARTLGDGKQTGYLPLSNSQKTAHATMISMDDISRWDRLLHAKQTLFLLDACLSGLAGVQPKSDYQAVSLAQLNQPARWLFAAGTASEETIVSERWGGESIYRCIHPRGFWRGNA